MVLITLDTNRTLAKDGVEVIHILSCSIISDMRSGPWDTW